MNNAAIVFNIRNFIRRINDILPFPISITRLAFLSCVYDTPRRISNIAKLMDATRSTAATSMLELQSAKLVKKLEGVGSPYAITNLGLNLLSAFANAANGGVYYE